MHSFPVHQAAACPAPRRAIFIAVTLAVSVSAAPPRLQAAEAAPAAEKTKADRSLAFAIPPQPLEEAINDFIAATDWQVGFPANLAKGVRSPGVTGRYTPAQALQKLLAGTGVSARTTAKGTVTLEKKSVAPPAPATPPPPAKPYVPQSDAAVLPAVTVTGTSASDYLVGKDPREKDYTIASSSRTATKTDTPIFDTPVSIQVVPRAVMEDQKSTRAVEALENVSGVRSQPSLGFGSSFIVRGFRMDRIYRNGLLATGNSFPSDFDTATLDSVEVLKGPAAALYGRNEPGGLINVTTKKALDAPYYSLEQRFGSYDFYRTEWDAGGAVIDDKSLLYRFSGGYQSNNSFRDFISNDRVAVSPTLTWRPDEMTDVTLNIEGVDQTFQGDFGIPAVGNRPAPVPISNMYGDTNDPKDHMSKVYLGTEVNHRFNEDWAVHNRFLASWLHTDTTFVNPSPAFGDALRPDNRTLDRNIFSQTDDVESYATNLDLTGKFNLGRTKHNVLLGFDYLRSFTTYHTQGDWQNPDPALAIDLYHPSASYGIPPLLYKTALLTYVQPGREYSRFKDEWYGLYFQDQITLWDKLHILGGGRYNWTEVGRGRGATYAQADSNLPSRVRSDDGFSPRVGILYQPWDWLDVYGNWTESFGANNGVSASGASFDPETGEQFEAGVKASLFDHRLLATLAYYHLTKDNILTPDLSTLDPTDSAAIGQARSQGVELDVAGNITDELSLIGSYAYTDARITKDNGGNEGKRLNNVPENAGSLWVKYEFMHYAPLNGLSFGIGGVATGQREGDVANSFQMPGYVRMDLFAGYQWRLGATKMSAQINIRNVLDKQYYVSTDPDANVSPRLGVYPGAPLTAIGSVRVEY